MSSQKIKKFYSENAKYEWGRLIRDPYHKLEYETTLHFLKKYLPKKGLILDAGGGPGRYTIELAKQGYDVVLLDITPELIEFAKKQVRKEKVQNKVKNIIIGSITDLSIFDDNTFDAIICLGGPISHLKNNKERQKAVSELTRVAKKNAPIFASVMGKLGVLIGSLRFWPEEMRFPNFKQIIEKGDDYRWHGGHYAHFFVTEELKNLFNRKRLKILELAGLQGISTHSRKEINKFAKHDKEIWKVWLGAHYKFCTRPEIVGISEHMLIVCRKI